MKARGILSGAVLVLATAAITSQVVSQEAKQPPAMSPEEQAMMAKWTEYATPNQHHKVLAEKVGKWDMTVKMWMDPAAPASESKANATYEMGLDGRYLMDHTSGMSDMGPFEGRGCTGYDNLKKKYVAVWIDNMGTGIMYGEGSYDAAKKTFTYTMDGPDLEAGKYVKSRATERWTDEDTWVMESFKTGKDGKEFKQMEITYARAK